ncbi:glycosyltransferase family 10 domain-containing protein [Roseivivax isoporae]|uniref:Fucosyltransferase C-terminal domain-containing protein n=1 Tax=Roseivivax isoporae LMG 25204 TaxID=1449351 RepID=X7F4I1_9RHOB|nr:glycosyltransferase family 10 [Roseivivax isoporae]ETX26991.1 hypothetical protein RISW2_17150 [Roseivivax isoporae LMG 25204]
MIRVFACGDYAHRQPLAYAPIRAAAVGRLRLVERIGTADIVIVAHVKDIAAHGADLRRQLGAGQRLVLLSEEPFWDTVWGDDPRVRDRTAPTEAGAMSYTWLNHATSDVFAFDAIPYFPLTDHHFATRYRRWFAQNAQVPAAEWLARWRRARWRTVFMARRRHGAAYSRAFGPDLFGLSALRTVLAEACPLPATLRAGTGWGDAMRQELPDWHLDKMLRIAGRAALVSAIENTHHPHYVTEKLFDAYAAGAVPLYVAGQGHRARDLAAEEAWLNLAGDDVAAAVARLAEFDPDTVFAEAYAATQARLAALWGDPEVLAAELDRLAGAIATELGAVLSA